MKVNIHTISVSFKVISDKPMDKLTTAEMLDAIEARLVKIKERNDRHAFELQESEEAETPDGGGKLRCSWCCRDTRTKPCEHCDNDMAVIDRTKPHRPEWSRASTSEVECKICDRRGPYSIQRESAWCDSRNNPAITGIHEP